MSQIYKEGITLAHPVMLCYNLKDDRAHRISLMAMQHGIHLRPVKPEEYHQTIAALLDMEEPVNSLYDGEKFDREMLLMANFPGALLNSFLNAFHESKIPPVRLKCMLTENNSHWTSLHLHEELSQEEIYFNAIRLETQKRKKEAEEMDPKRAALD